MKLIEKMPQELLDATNELAKKLEWGRRIPVYEVHKWWARRYSAIVRLFLIYSQLDYDVINKVTDYRRFVTDLYKKPPEFNGRRLLDPFAGGGTIILEAARLGFESYGIEINKLAFLLLDSYRELERLNFKEFKKEVLSFAEEINKRLWSTRCESGHEAVVIHTFLTWKNNNGKPQIRENVIKELNNGKSIYFCEVCGRIYEEKSGMEHCVFCNNRFNKSPSGIIEYHELYPYAIEYYCPICGVRGIKKVDIEDEEKFFFTKQNVYYASEIPSLNETKRLLRKGFKYFEQLLTPRQRAVFHEFLSRFKGTRYETIAKIMVSDSLRACSLLAYYSPRYRKVIPGFSIKSYWLPPQPVELNPVSFVKSTTGLIKPLGRGNLISSLVKIERAYRLFHKREYTSNYKIYLGSAQKILQSMNENDMTFDVVFTDPPYADYQYYSDLSLFGLSIIGEIDDNYLKSLLKDEIVLRNKKEYHTYLHKLFQVFKEAKRLLSDDGKILVTFHHKNPDVILDFVKIFKKLNLNLDAVYPVLGESSGNLINRKLYIDLLFVFSKKRKTIPHFVPTNIYITKDDKKLIELGELIARGYANEL